MFDYLESLQKCQKKKANKIVRVHILTHLNNSLFDLFIISYKSTKSILEDLKQI